jgi:transcriptional regulator GlxA family with amidase domain
MDHTEGKLEYAHRQRADGMYWTELFDAKGVTVASAAWYPIKTETGTTTNREANARRLVACWNEHDDLVKERDKLVKALRDMRGAWNQSRSFNAMDAMFAQVDSILAKYPETPNA